MAGSTFSTISTAEAVTVEDAAIAKIGDSDGGSYTSNGLSSPAIYSTADITVSNGYTLYVNGVALSGTN